MESRKESPTSDPLKEAETLVAIAEELERLADEAWERARAAVERADNPPLLARLAARR